MSGSENTHDWRNRTLASESKPNAIGLANRVAMDLDALANRVSKLEQWQGKRDRLHRVGADNPTSPDCSDAPVAASVRTAASPAAPEDEALVTALAQMLDEWLPPSKAVVAAALVLAELRRLGRLK